jgi:hypothetical protein
MIYGAQQRATCDVLAPRNGHYEDRRMENAQRV